MDEFALRRVDVDEVPMRAVRSRGEGNLIYVLLSDAEAADLRKDLRKRKDPLAKAVRKALKRVLRA